MMLIAGLGNPGYVYARSRHNIGFMCVRHLARTQGIKFDKKQGYARICSGEIAGEKVVLARPQTYMNASGESVSRLVKRLRISPSENPPPSWRRLRWAQGPRLYHRPPGQSGLLPRTRWHRATGYSGRFCRRQGRCGYRLCAQRIHPRRKKDYPEGHPCSQPGDTLPAHRGS